MFSRKQRQFLREVYLWLWIDWLNSGLVLLFRVLMEFQFLNWIEFFFIGFVNEIKHLWIDVESEDGGIKCKYL